jgi:hypothetical protein
VIPTSHLGVLLSKRIMTLDDLRVQCSADARRKAKGERKLH